MWCQVAIQTCADAVGDLHEVHFVLFGSEAFGEFCAAAEAHAPGSGDSAAADTSSTGDPGNKL